MRVRGFWAAGIAAMTAGLVGSGTPADASDFASVLPGPIRAEVLRVIDGDTIEVRAAVWVGQSVTTKVRLAAVDAPELSAICPEERDKAVAARAFVEQWLDDTADGLPVRVRLRTVRYGKYAGRVVADVEAGDESGGDLGQALLSAGHARAYGGGGRKGWCGERAAG